MSDLISRKSLLNKINAYVVGSHDKEFICKLIKEMPSVENRGTWRHYEGMLYCPKCGAEFYDEIMEYTGDKVPKHCPDCGADMREPIGEKIRCNTCVNNDDELSGECYECLKGIFDHYEKKTEVENGRTND